ncbi:hypothetical protein [Legionella cardiaca]|uniref:Uncharacterized protein n=1 Tax=Legionella cardiaca TaxID=1071983 RepID=A0ABY8ANV0_9GAMM|nr:hypothetical protein [Legionella cardiaca]WED41936.1 hypothetical protein PXX05_08300 [Legionella cardiaca]
MLKQRSRWRLLMHIKNLMQFYQILSNRHNQSLHSSFSIIKNKFDEFILYSLDSGTAKFDLLSQQITSNSLAFQKCGLTSEIIAEIALDIKNGGHNIFKLMEDELNIDKDEVLTFEDVTSFLSNGETGHGDVLSSDVWKRKIKDELHSFFNCSNRNFKKDETSNYSAEELFNELSALLKIKDGNELYEKGSNNELAALMICSTPALVTTLRNSCDLSIKTIKNKWSEKYPEHRGEINCMMNEMVKFSDQIIDEKMMDTITKNL